MNDIKIGDNISANDSVDSKYKLYKDNTVKLMDMIINADISNADDFHDNFQKIYTFIQEKNTESRLLYSVISNKIYELEEWQLNDLESACEMLIEYSHSYTNNDVIVDKIILKLADHINLALAQERYIQKYNDTEVQYRIDAIDNYMSKADRLEERIENINTQIISVLGIFTAISFVLFGGISSAASILDKLKNPSIGQLLIFGGIWGIILYNVVYFLIYYISKLTKISIKTNDRINASVYRRHPYICVINFMLLCITIIGVWLYFIEYATGNQWIKSIVSNNKDFLTFGTSFLIIILIGVGIWLVHKITDESKDW